MNEQQPGSWPPPPGGDPKAAAKAAKAYAKASRPWYKKKRFILPLALVVIVVIASAAGAGGGSGDDGPKVVENDKASNENKSDSNSNDEGEKDEGDKVGEQGNPAKIGQTIELEGTRYTVNSARTTQRVGDEYFGEDADGTFVVVEITIENTKDETKTFVEDAARFVTNEDKKYDADTEAAIMASEEGDTLFLKEMHPDLPTTGQLIFDVPPTKTKGGLLEVSDLFGGGEAYFALGLN